MKRTSLLAVGALALAVAAPGVAQASTKSVQVGVPVKSQKAFQAVGADANAFYLGTTVIHAGDKVKFLPNGFHTVDFPAKGEDPLPLIAPVGTKVANSNDAGGAAFWFNGQDNLFFNTDLLVQNWGKKVTMGSQRITSGLPLSEKPKALSVRFKKVGKYKYYCNVHPGQVGTIDVRKKGKKIPNPAKDRVAIAKQLSTDVKNAKEAAQVTPPANTVYLGSAAKNGVEVFAFFPSTLSVPVGTTITFKMTELSREIHTATTGPGDPEKDPSSYLGQIAASLEGQGPFDPRGLYPSEMPATPPASLTPTLHGNGFWNSGALDSSPGTIQPDSSTVTLGAAGTYTFYCMIHPFMKGTITAT